MDGLTEGDLTLISALQIRPRATWSELSLALGEPPRSLAVRWDRIQSAGTAWLTAYIASSQYRPLALVEMDIATETAERTCRELIDEPRVVSIERLATGRDLLLTVIGSDMHSLSRFIVDRLTRITGVLRVRSNLVAAVHTDGARWRLGGLNQHQAKMLSDLAPIGVPSSNPSAPDSIIERHRPIIDALRSDPRISAAQLAARLGRPESTVRRQLSAVLRSGVLTFRCEVSQDMTDWTLLTSWWLRVPENRRSEVVARLQSDRRTRFCCSVAGRTNVFVSMWIRDLSGVLTTQGWLEGEVGITVDDVAVTLSTVKRIGWVLDPHGRATGEMIPLSDDLL